MQRGSWEGGGGKKSSLSKVPPAPSLQHPPLPGDTAFQTAAPTPYLQDLAQQQCPQGAEANGASLNTWGALACTPGRAAETERKRASQRGEVLTKHTQLQAQQSCHRGPVDTIPTSDVPGMPTQQPLVPTYLVLAIGTQKVSLSQPGDDGLGVPERHAGQGDTAALLRLYVLRWCLCEGGGSCGAEGDPCEPPHFTHGSGVTLGQRGGCCLPNR